MTVVESPKTAGLIQRVQNILTKPAAEWDVIEAEPATVQGLYVGYICILAAIPAIGSLIGSLFGLHWLIVITLISVVLSYALGLAGVFVMSLIIDALAPSFGGQKNQIQALKLAGYSYTGSWVSGIFLIIPYIGPLIVVLGGLYSLYLMYLGLPKLMKSPADKTVAYFVVSLLVAIVVYAIVAAIVGAIIASIVTGMMVAGAAAVH
jgi:hypothetical protein